MHRDISDFCIQPQPKWVAKTSGWSKMDPVARNLLRHPITPQHKPLPKEIQCGARALPGCVSLEKARQNSNVNTCLVCSSLMSACWWQKGTTTTCRRLSLSPSATCRNLPKWSWILPLYPTASTEKTSLGWICWNLKENDFMKILLRNFCPLMTEKYSNFLLL